MFGRKREIYEDIDTDWIRLASSHPEIANAIMAKERLEKENLSLKDQIARLKEQLSDKASPSGSIITDPAMIKTIEERDRLEKENLELKAKLDGFKQAAAPFDGETQADMRAEIDELKNRIRSEIDLSKSLSDALNKNREELARIKENYKEKTMAENNEITQWEYKKESYHDPMFGFNNYEKLANLGKEGWELQCSIDSDLIFKRPKQDTKKSKAQDFGYGR